MQRSMPHSPQANKTPVGKGLVPNRYQAIIELIFAKHHQAGEMAFEFSRDDIVGAAQSLAVALPKKHWRHRLLSPLPYRVAADHPRGGRRRSRVDH